MQISLNLMYLHFDTSHALSSNEYSFAMPLHFPTLYANMLDFLLHILSYTYTYNSLFSFSLLPRIVKNRN